MANSVERVVWFTANSLAVLDDVHRLYIFNIKADSALGQFGKKGLVRLQQLDPKDTSYDLAAISTHTIAYIDKSNIWSLDIPATNAVQLTHLTNASLGALDYDPAIGGLYVNMGNYSYQFNPRVATNNGLTRIDRKYYSPADLFSGGHVQSYSVTPKGDKIYAVASQWEEPMKIWECDIADKSLHAIVDPANNLKFSQSIVPNTNSFTLKRVLRIGTITEPIKMDWFTLNPAGASLI